VSELDLKERAVAAAESLAAEGLPVTARAVRARAKVTSAVATAAAREWNEQVSGLAVTAIPDAVQRRVDALWAAALAAANAEWDDARDFMEGKVKNAQDEVDGLSEDLIRLEGQFDEAEAGRLAALKQVQLLEARLLKCQDEVRDCQVRAEREIAKAQAEAAEFKGMVEGLREAIAARQRPKTTQARATKTSV